MDTNGTVPSQIIIGGQEYTPEEAQELIETGRKTHDYEQKWNVSLDKVWPEYGKSREELKTISYERDELKQKLADFDKKKEEGTETPADIAQAREAARKLGLVLTDDLSKGEYVKKSDLDTYFSQKTQEQEAVKEVLREADDLEKELNGSDGRPKFVKKHVLAYAQAYGISNLREAYEDMHKDELEPWKEAELAKKKHSSLTTLNSGGKKTPQETKVNDDNVKELLSETLWGNKQ